MGPVLRLCLFNASQKSKPEFQAAFEQLQNVEIVASCATWELLQQCLQLGHADAVAINLDHQQPQFGLHMVQRIAEVAPECGLIGVSERSDPETIIGAMRAGCNQFVRYPIDPSDLISAIDRIRAVRAPVAVSKQICVVGSAGGAGATTVACNLAIELAHITNKRCGLIDLNLEFGDVACMFDATPKYTVADVCRDGIEIDRMLIETAMVDLPCNVSILARPDRVEQAREITPEGIENMLQIVGHMFPYVVIDLPRMYSFLSAAALRDADRVLLVTQIAVPFLRNATRIYESLAQMGANEERLEIVLNRCNANFERITPEEVEQHFGRPIFAIIPNDYRRVTSSRDLGHPMMTDAPNSPVRVAIQTMAHTLAAEQRQAIPGQRSTGLLSKLLRRGAGAKA